MKALRPIMLALALHALVPHVVRAQGPASAPLAGDRIRVERLGARPESGRLLSRSDSEIVVRWRTGRQETVPLYEVGRIDVSDGRQRSLVRGTLFGTGVGLAVGAILYSVRRDSYGANAPRNPSLLPVSTLAGTVLGAIVGTFGSERWRTVYSATSQRRVGARAAVQRGRWQLALSEVF